MKKWISAVSAVVISGMLSTLAFAADLDEIKARGVLRHIGIPYANFVSGAGDGMEVELTKLFAKSLGVKYEFVQSDWGTIVQDLIGKKVKVAAGKAELLDFLKQAIEDRQRFAKKGVKQATPYERRVVWSITAVTPHLISLRNAWFDDTGGAHPNHGSDVLLWDRVHNVMLLQGELFKSDVDTTVVDTLLCQATTRAKEARLGPTDPKRWSCPKFADGHAVMVPSTQPYRIGGMMFLFDPYTIGAYAEGDYEVLLPLTDFKSILAPAWAGDFAGSPAPSVRPRP